MKLPAIALALMTAAGMLGACASNEPLVFNGGSAHAERIEYGVVEHIDLFREGQSAPTGVGAILGDRVRVVNNRVYRA